MAKKRTLGSLIDEQMETPAPAHYPTGSSPAEDEESSASTPARRRSTATEANPAKAKTARTTKAGERGAQAPVAERRKALTVDLSFDPHYLLVRDLADELDCTKVEIIRALLNIAGQDRAAMTQRIEAELGHADVHRPKGFEGNSEAAVAAQASRRKIH